jgi:hypothetical protein
MEEKNSGCSGISWDWCSHVARLTQDLMLFDFSYIKLVSPSLESQS